MFVLLFPKIYEQINNKLIIFFIILELLMIIRLVFYTLLLYEKEVDPSNQWFLITYYLSEFFLIGMSQYMTLKNS